MSLTLIKRIYKLFSESEKRGLALILLITIITSCIQALGVASIMPFIALISSPEIAQINPFVISISDWLGIQDNIQLVFTAGIFAFLIFALGNVLTTLDTWLSVRFFYLKDYKLSILLLNKYLNKSWPVFQKKNTPEMTKIILSDVDRVIESSFLAFTGLISKLIVTSCIVTLLLWIDIYVTLITALILGLSYWLIYTLISDKVNTLGKQFTLLESDIYQSLEQSLKFYKEAKLTSSENYFITKFSNPLKTATDNAIKYATLSIIPVQLVELLAFGIIIAVALYFYSIQANDVVTTIAIYAFAAYKLVPLLKSIFDSIESMKFGSSVLDLILNELEQKEVVHANNSAKDVIILQDSISLKNIHFRYAKHLPWVLQNQSLTIPAAKITVIKGRSGIGKSTTMDLLLGLQRPEQGHIEVDGKQVTESDIKSWQNSISYVPQDVQLLDDSIEANIAFASKSSDLNSERLQNAINLAELGDVINSFPDKEKTIIGARGISLSGGQKQRIGLARVLYDNKRILFLDEFTNELDNETEEKILSNLRSIKNITIVCISHKASMINIADQIIEIK